MTKHEIAKVLVLVCCAASLQACSTTEQRTAAPTMVQPEDYPGIDVGTASAAILSAGACTGGSADGSTSITIALSNGETAVLSLRPTDNMVIVNGVPSENCQLALAPTVAFPGQFPTGKTITITAKGTVAASDSRSVILDYVNGLWGEATTGTTGVVSINLGTAASVNNYVKIRGSANADAFALGKGIGTGTQTAGGPYLLNINGGTVAPLDSVPDVAMTNVQNVVVSTGQGNDKIIADGTLGTTAAYPWPIQMYGGTGNDTLTGGAGGDYIFGDLGADTMTGGAGANTYYMGTVPQGSTGATTSDTITVTNSGVDTVDYSDRTAALTVTLATTPVSTSGETGEGATISDAVAVVLGGNANDTITAAGSARNHTIKGGLGNDTLTGSSTTGVDTLIGGNGDALTGDGDDVFAGAKATVDYSARTSALTVKLDSAGATPTSGDLTGTIVPIKTITAATASGIAAPVTAAGVTTAVMSGLAGMSTTDSPGHYITLSATTGGTDDGTYKITACSSATSCTLDVTANTAFVADTKVTISYLVNAHARVVQATTASTGTITASGSLITGLANMTAASVGHYLVTTLNAVGGNNSGVVGFKIATVPSSTSVTVSGATLTNDATGFSWSEQVNYDEADNVKVGTVKGSAGVNTITAVDTGTHTIYGGAAADFLYGNAGTDVIWGYGGADTMYGGDGDDTLNGGDANDTLYGGDGNDVLSGDAGTDTFECDGNNSPTSAGTAPGNTDWTTDFTPSGAGVDTLPRPATCE